MKTYIQTSETTGDKRNLFSNNVVRWNTKSKLRSFESPLTLGSWSATTSRSRIRSFSCWSLGSNWCRVWCSTAFQMYHSSLWSLDSPLSSPWGKRIPFSTARLLTMWCSISRYSWHSSCSSQTLHSSLMLNSGLWRNSIINWLTQSTMSSFSRSLTGETLSFSSTC